MGLHDCDLDAVEAVFCGNAHRADLFVHLKACLEHMRASQLQGTVILNGSFVTDKETPADIEMTLDVRARAAEDQLRAIQYFHNMHQQVKDDWKVDWYPTIDGVGQNNFVNFFQYVGVKTAAIKSIQADTPKGILRLTTW